MKEKSTMELFKEGLADGLAGRECRIKGRPVLIAEEGSAKKARRKVKRDNSYIRGYNKGMMERVIHS